MSDLPVITIQKLTVRYDEREDRLLLAAKCDTGQVRGLWLTQRLATPLIRVILKRLGEVVMTEARSAPQSKPSTLRQIALQTWEQSTAQAKQMSSANDPVSVPPDIQYGLVDEINVICRPGGNFQLNFRLSETAPLCLPLTSILARQWLAVLRTQYQRAEWHVPGLWPAWFDAALRTEWGEASRVH